jgi:hypothetical protein
MERWTAYDWREKKMEQNQHEIKLMLDDNRYNNLLDLCKKYRTQHSTNLTPTEYILILIDSAIDSVDGTKEE